MHCLHTGLRQQNGSISEAFSMVLNSFWEGRTARVCEGIFKMPRVLPKILSLLAYIQAVYLKEISADYSRRLHYP